MLRTIIIPAVALLALVGCDEQKSSQAQTTTTAATEPKVADPTTAARPEVVAAAPATVPEANARATASRAGSLDAYSGRTFTAGPVSLRLNADNTFRMDETDGNRKVEGQWQFASQSNLLVLSDPKGDAGTAQFPMRCHFQESGDAFRLGETAGSCARFKDMTFKPAAG